MRKKENKVSQPCRTKRSHKKVYDISMHHVEIAHIIQQCLHNNWNPHNNPEQKNENNLIQTKNGDLILIHAVKAFYNEQRYIKCVTMHINKKHYTTKIFNDNTATENK